MSKIDYKDYEDLEEDASKESKTSKTKPKKKKSWKKIKTELIKKGYEKHWKNKRRNSKKTYNKNT